jgi:hypothetical protein
LAKNGKSRLAILDATNQAVFRQFLATLR